MRNPVQSALDLGKPMPSEAALRAAYDRTNCRKPFHQALADPALSICLRNLALAGAGRRTRRAR